MSLDHNPQCSACKIANSLMWRRGSNGEILCNSCHLKRVNSSVRAQRQSSKESKKLIARIKAGTRKGWNGKSGERSRGRRSLQKMKRKVNLIAYYNIFYLSTYMPTWTINYFIVNCKVCFLKLLFTALLNSWKRALFTLELLDEKCMSRGRPLKLEWRKITAQSYPKC